MRASCKHTQRQMQEGCQRHPHSVSRDLTCVGVCLSFVCEQAGVGDLQHDGQKQHNPRTIGANLM